MNEMNKEFMLELAALSTDFRSILSDHLKDNGELLPHVLMGDFARFVTLAAENSMMNSEKQLPAASIALLLAMEQQYTDGNVDLQEIIVVSFIENLPSTGASSRLLYNSLGSALREQYAKIHLFKNGSLNS